MAHSAQCTGFSTGGEVDCGGDKCSFRCVCRGTAYLSSNLLQAGQAALQSGGAFGFFMGVGAALRC